MSLGWGALRDVRGCIASLNCGLGTTYKQHLQCEALELGSPLHKPLLVATAASVVMDAGFDFHAGGAMEIYFHDLPDFAVEEDPVPIE